MNSLDLHYLATQSSEKEREGIADKDLLIAHRENIESILSALDKELHVLTIKALTLTDAYWSYVDYLHAEQRQGESFSFFTVRVRLDEKRNNLSITWQRRYPTWGRSKYGRTTNSKSLAKGPGFRYPEKAFGKIRDWEYEAVEAAEQRFEKVRRQVEAIGKLRRSVRALGRLNEKSYK